MEDSSRRATVRRLAVTLLYALAFACSLVVFPNAIAWLVAGWLTIATVQIARGRSAWFPLAIGLLVLVIKQPEWSPGLIAFALSLLVATAYLFLRRGVINTDTRVRSAWVIVAVVWGLWIVWCWQMSAGMHRSQKILLVPDRPIVCLGDSLTTGLADGEAYPEYLRGLVTVPVVNWGRAGVTARDMTKHLPEILASRPQLVIVELGGHDFLRGYGRDATWGSLVTIIEACRDADAEVVLMEIPRGFINDQFAGLERELAREYDLELIPDSLIRLVVVRSPAIPILRDVATPHLSGDGLHPNAVGAEYLARSVYSTLHRIYGPAITSSPPETP